MTSPVTYGKQLGVGLNTRSDRRPLSGSTGVRRSQDISLRLTIDKASIVSTVVAVVYIHMAERAYARCGAAYNSVMRRQNI